MNKITAQQIRQIQKATHASRICQGLDKLPNVPKGITEITRILANLNFNLDMVSGDILLGEKGTRLLPFSFADGTSTGKYISFTWENLSNDPFNPRFEIIAYLA